MSTMKRLINFLISVRYAEKDNKERNHALLYFNIATSERLHRTNFPSVIPFFPAHNSLEDSRFDSEDRYDDADRIFLHDSSTTSFPEEKYCWVL